MFCKNCGKEIDDNSKFCQFCGNQNENNSIKYKIIIAILSLILVLQCSAAYASDTMSIDDIRAGKSEAFECTPYKNLCFSKIVIDNYKYSTIIERVNKDVVAFKNNGRNIDYHRDAINVCKDINMRLPNHNDMTTIGQYFKYGLALGSSANVYIWLQDGSYLAYYNNGRTIYTHPNGMYSVTAREFKVLCVKEPPGDTPSEAFITSPYTSIYVGKYATRKEAREAQNAINTVLSEISATNPKYEFENTVIKRENKLYSVRIGHMKAKAFNMFKENNKKYKLGFEIWTKEEQFEPTSLHFL